MVPARTSGLSAENPTDTGACCSGQLPGGEILVASLSDSATLRLVTLPPPGAAAGGQQPASCAARAADGASLVAVHAYREGLVAVLSQPQAAGGDAGREVAFFRAADIAGAAVSLSDLEAADTVQLSGRQEVDCLALGEQRRLGAVFGRKRVALYDLAALG